MEAKNWYMESLRRYGISRGMRHKRRRRLNRFLMRRKTAGSGRTHMEGV